MACALSLGLLLTLGVSAQQPDQCRATSRIPQPQGQAQQQDQSAQPQSQGDSSQAQGQSQDQPPPPAASAPQDQPPAQPQDQAPPPPPAKKPKYAPQDANRPPYSNDYPAPAAGAPAHAPSPDQYDLTRICRQGSKVSRARRVHRERLTADLEPTALRRTALPTTMATRTLTGDRRMGRIRGTRLLQRRLRQR